MPERGVAAGCNLRRQDGVSLYRFPSDEQVKKLWIKQVKTHRAHWDGPSTYSVLCSHHFKEDCFEEGPLQLTEEYVSKRKLRKDAIPTVFPKANYKWPPAGTESSDIEPPKKRAAFVKRHRARVSNKNIYLVLF